METIYDRIYKLRTLHEMTQEQLAYKMGYSSRSMINKIEKGKVDLPYSKIMLFAEVLHTTPIYLICGNKT